MTPKDSLEKAAEEYYQANPHYYGVTQAEIDERNTYAIRSAFKAGAKWQAEQEDARVACVLVHHGKLETERDQWKSEYQNLCKFANDYEEQRDAWKKQAEALAEALNQIKEKSISDLPLGTWMFWRAIASEALKAFEEFKKSGK